MTEPLLTIGELAQRAGVATSALRYWEELGVLPAADRVSGQRRYPESAVDRVAAVLLLRDVGFTLAEQKELLASRDRSPGGWRRLVARKLAELDEQIAKARVAHDALAHAVGCPHDDLLACPSFGRIAAARLEGQPFDGRPLGHRPPGSGAAPAAS